ncbi:radical SAM family heme chaperone HemW [Trueperella sp. LYQ143]|uniref:radical SAM family heme chaperone HemW n=1 Tax=unclassified Trueperella TaxID=2630174 RepID=UPI00398319B0
MPAAETSQGISWDRLELPATPVANLSAYIHIPFCAARCGYCDFNTYTNLHFGAGASAAVFDQRLVAEMDLLAQHLRLDQPLSTVFFGGGTPTILPATTLVAIYQALCERFGGVRGEVTTEANPETVTQEDIDTLAAGGFTRISFGMQSARQHVLTRLDRKHTPGKVAEVTRWARQAGLDYSLDLIYGTSGESREDWRISLETAISYQPGHISAYGLTIEPGTAMGAQLRRGQISAPDPDVLADKYELADEILNAAGYRWYEVSNWALPGKESQHNRAYWTNANWWGFGPGAHSHISGVRAWNIKHPVAYSRALAASNFPIADWEVLSQREREEEAIMLGIRLREGIGRPQHVPDNVLADLITDGLIEAKMAREGRICLTRRGRLLADRVIAALWED